MTTLSHATENLVGIVEEVGRDVRNLRVGTRVVIPSTIACGYCSYCRAGYQSQCDNANPNGTATAFFGGPETNGAFDGLQAEFARVPFAAASLVVLPDEIDDMRAILLSDIFPTGYFGAELAEIDHGDTVVIYGCGPVGQFAIASAKLLGAFRIFAVDCVESRLDMARRQGAEVIDFNREDPVETVMRLTGGIGPDRAIDCVGVDAVAPQSGPAAQQAQQQAQEFQQEVSKIAPDAKPQGDLWVPGNAPSQAHEWAVKSLAKAGTLAVIGVYPETDKFFPIGAAMNKNLTVRMGNCNHRSIVPTLVDLVRSGVFDPSDILTQAEPLTDVIEAYRSFDRREPGWIKVMLDVNNAAQSGLQGSRQRAPSTTTIG